MKRCILLGAMAIFSCTVTLAQQKQISRKDLLQADLHQQVASADIKEITMTAGQVAPKHLHPCPVVGYLKSGKVLFQIEGEEKVILSEGDAFYEPKNKNILHFDNLSADKPLTFVAIYLKEGNEDLIRLIK
ncbi:cupin domain-containing protein [Pedobacter sp. AW31-3R]|uniref:cupin domain-containing protein n=1 Tax=Pedobacter sp. AW31-3R TaxID=3445781 RepID=UPI003FA0D903